MTRSLQKSTSGSPCNDAQLWNKFQRGDKVAYADIYYSFFDSLYHYGRHFCQDQGLIEDCIQDLFINIWQSRQNLAPVASIKFYLFKSLRRMILDRVRKQHILSFTDNPGKQNADFFLASCEAQIIDKQVSERKNSVLYKALEKLTCRQKEAIFLRFYEELSYQEIAFLMSFKSVKSVRNMIYAAINNIKKNIAADPKLSLMECLNICLSLF